MIALGWLLAALALPALVACGYLLVLTLASGRLEAPETREPTSKLALVVPAHDEEQGIARTVASLAAVSYPAGLFRVHVVADNCSDGTAAAARAAGATVWERTDADLRGKGYALEFAFKKLLDEGWADAAIVIDADTVVSANLLSAFDARLHTGALAVQADYAVQNPEGGWRTRLMRIALALFHVVRSRGRERLGLSCGLRGNGMCFSMAALRRVPHEAFSLVEDLEYGVRLGLAGIRVRYADEAHVFGEMVSTSAAAESQRRRWEGGRLRIARELGPKLVAAALSRRDRVLTDLALDVLTPPLAQLAAFVGLGTLLAAGLRWAGGPLVPLALWAGCGLCLVVYLFRGWQVSGTGARGLVDLLFGPVYVVWKLGLLLGRRGPKRTEWVRTQREGQKP